MSRKVNIEKLFKIHSREDMGFFGLCFLYLKKLITVKYQANISSFNRAAFSCLFALIRDYNEQRSTADEHLWPTSCCL